MPTQTTRLNIEKQDSGDTDWKGAEDSFKDKMDAVSASYFNVQVSGVAEDEAVVLDGFKFDEDVDISGVTLFARVAPAGADLTVDFLLNATEQTKVATLEDGSQKQYTAISGLSYTSLQELGLKIKSVGSTEAGSEVSIVIHYHVSPIP